MILKVLLKKYGERRIKIADSVCRRCGHILHHGVLDALLPIMLIATSNGLGDSMTDVIKNSNGGSGRRLGDADSEGASGNSSGHSNISASAADTDNTVNNTPNNTTSIVVQLLFLVHCSKIFWYLIPAVVFRNMTATWPKKSVWQELEGDTERSGDQERLVNSPTAHAGKKKINQMRSPNSPSSPNGGGNVNGGSGINSLNTSAAANNNSTSNGNSGNWFSKLTGWFVCMWWRNTRVRDGYLARLNVLIVCENEKY
jgi:hypothetical protein